MGHEGGLERRPDSTAIFSLRSDVCFVCLFFKVSIFSFNILRKYFSVLFPSEVIEFICGFKFRSSLDHLDLGYEGGLERRPDSTAIFSLRSDVCFEGFFFKVSIFSFNILRKYFSVLFALEVIEFIFVFKFRSLEMLIPRHFAENVDFNSIPCSL